MGAGRIRKGRGARRRAYRRLSFVGRGFVCWVLVGSIGLAIALPSLAEERFAEERRERSEPADEIEAAPGDWFAAEFTADAFSPDSLTDLSALIEAPAGKDGFLAADGDGLRFERARRPIRFWAVGVGRNPHGLDGAGMTRAARFYRKHGINMVRQHTMMDAVGLLGPDGKFDPARMDAYDRWFAALKRAGIYTTWSVVYPHHGPFLRKSDGYSPERFAELDRVDTRHDGRREPIVVGDFVNLDRDLQAIVGRYFDALLAHRNPHTGLRYRDDPALAIIEFQNESNVFFHTLDRLREGDQTPLFSDRMRRAFYAFARARYGSRAAVARAWGGRWDRYDDWEAGRLGLMAAYHWGADGPLHEFAGQLRRTGDYLEFLTELQRGVFERREAQLRAAGWKGVTVATAWRSGGPAASLANLFADSAADMIDRHNYLGGGAGGHRLAVGRVDNSTHLDRPGRGLLAVGLFQMAHHPFAVSEWSMLPPSPFKAEAAPLVAFYGMALQGWDVATHFTAGPDRMGSGWPGLRKYVSHTPHYMGQFPALARAIHERHLQPGPVVARRVVDRAGIFAGRDVLGQALSAGGHDEKRLSGSQSTPPEVLAIGRVTLEFDLDAPGAGGAPDSNGMASREPRSEGTGAADADWQRFWDRKARTIRSATGELEWDYGRRVVRVDSDRTRAVIGFAGGQTFVWPGLRVEVSTPFVSLLFTSLDGRAIEQAERVLITAMAREKQTDARFDEDWSRLFDLGRPPLLMEPVQATIRFESGAESIRVRPLDLYGVPRPGRVVPVDDDGRFSIDGRHRTYYYVVDRPASSEAHQDARD